MSAHPVSALSATRPQARRGHTRTRRRHTRARPGHVLPSLLGVALLTAALAACGSSKTTQPPYITVLPSATTIASPTTTSTASTSSTPRAETLTGVCPSPVVVQLDGPLDLWALPYTALAATDGTPNGPTYQAALINVDPVKRGTASGVDIQLRTQSAIGLGVSSATAVLNDPTILFGAATIDTVLPKGAVRPVVVAAPWSHNDLALRWTMSSTVSSAKTIADLAGTVIANPDSEPQAAAYLQASGLLPRKRDVRIVRPDAKPEAVTGDATLFHVLDNPAASTPLITKPGLERAQLVADVGWEPYPHTLITRGAGIDERADCLRALVPQVQWAVERIAADPAAAVEHLRIIAAKSGAPIDAPLVLAQLRAALALRLLSTGNDDAPISADVKVGRFTQIARAQVFASRVIRPRLRLPDDLDKETALLLDRNFLDSSVRFDAKLG